MSKPSAPPPPDYAAAATAQGAANEQTAITNNAMNRVDQVGPYGNITYTLRPGADPNNPQVGEYIQTTTLSPEQQALLDQKQQITGQFASTAGSLVNNLQQNLTPYDASKLPAYQYAGAVPTYQQAPGAATYQSAPGVMTGWATSGGGGHATVGNYATTAGNTTFQDAPGATQLTNLQGGPAVNIDQQLAALRAFASGNNPGSIDTAFGSVRGVPSAVDDASRQRVEQAIMSRLEPQFQKDEQDLRTRLLNSGVEVGTDAWNREMQRLAQQHTDARMQAVLAGGQEESRQVGLDQGLQQQEYGQALGRGNFAQAGELGAGNLALGYGNQTLNALGMNIQGTLGANAQNFGQAQAVNASANQNALNTFGMQYQGAQMNNQNANSLYQQYLSNAQLQNQQAAAATGVSTTNAQLAQQAGQFNATLQNNALQQQFQEALAGTQMNNQNATTMWDQLMQGTQLNNQSASTAYSQGLAGAGFNNQTVDAQMAQDMYLRNLPLNEITALLSGSQIQTPQTSNYYTSGAQPAPVFDASVAQGNYNMSQYQQQMSGWNSFLGGLGSAGGAYLGTL